jgi:hypothetical protein
MLNSNLKSDIQKKILIKRLKTKNGQTEFDRVPTLVLQNFLFGLVDFQSKKSCIFDVIFLYVIIL